MKTEKSKSNNNRHVSAKALLAKVAATKKLAAAARQHLRLIKLEHKQARKAFKQAKKAAKIARKEAKASAKSLNTKEKQSGASAKAKGRTRTPSRGRVSRKTIAEPTRLVPAQEIQRNAPAPLAVSASLAAG